MTDSVVGTRIRLRRRFLNLRQVDLAARAGISPAYLNLIEHNRRAPTARILVLLADELQVPVEELSDGAESALESDLREAAVLNSQAPPETEMLAEFIGRFPGWARLTAALSREARDHSATLSAMAERMNYDPLLQNTLHEMLTNITAIRSSAGILVSEDDLPKDMEDRFQQAIRDESRRLSIAAQDLVSYFDRDVQTADGEASPQEAFEMFLANNGHVFNALEDADEAQLQIESIIEKEPLLANPEAQYRARQRLTVYAEDAQNMPLDMFYDTARSCGFAPVVLAQKFGVSVHDVFRRLAVLRRDGIDAPAFGLAIVNAAGQPLYRRPLSEFSLPRFAAICARWPLFQAFSSIGQAIQETIVLPDGREFFSFSLAQPLDGLEFGARQTMSSAMLVTSLQQALQYGLVEHGSHGSQRPVGTSCRLCPRQDCVARSEPNILLGDHS